MNEHLNKSALWKIIDKIRINHRQSSPYLQPSAPTSFAIWFNLQPLLASSLLAGLQQTSVHVSAYPQSHSSPSSLIRFPQLGSVFSEQRKKMVLNLCIK